MHGFCVILLPSAACSANLPIPAASFSLRQMLLP